MKRLTEIEKLRFWIDAEFTALHIMFGIIIFTLVSWWLWKVLLGAYIVWQFLYMLVRISYIATSDPNYLRLPRK